jgi:hypothetical protein
MIGSTSVIPGQMAVAVEAGRIGLAAHSGHEQREPAELVRRK